MENKPGNGKTSPFGNESGATSKGAANGSHDFTKNPTGNVGGAHDFVANPKPSNPGAAPQDFTKGAGATQKKGAAPDLCPQSVPTGGTTPFKGAPSATSKKPFKLNGGQAASMPENPMEQGSAGKPVGSY